MTTFQALAISTDLPCYCKCPGIHMSYFYINLLFTFRLKILVNLYYIFLPLFANQIYWNAQK